MKMETGKVEKKSDKTSGIKIDGKWYNIAGSKSYKADISDMEADLLKEAYTKARIGDNVEFCAENKDLIGLTIEQPEEAYMDKQPKPEEVLKRGEFRSPAELVALDLLREANFLVSSVAKNKAEVEHKAMCYAEQLDAVKITWHKLAEEFRNVVKKV